MQLHLLSVLVALSALSLPTSARRPLRRLERRDRCGIITEEGLVSVGLSPPTGHSCPDVCICHSEVSDAIHQDGCLPFVTKAYGQHLTRAMVKDLVGLLPFTISTCLMIRLGNNRSPAVSNATTLISRKASRDV